MSRSTPTLLPASLGEHTVEALFAAQGPNRPWIYWLLLGGTVAAGLSLPLVTVEVSVRATGLVRPATQRADLRAAVSGHIAAVLARDNSRVHPGQPLLVLRSPDLAERLAHNARLQTEHSALVADLQQLTAGEPFSPAIHSLLVTPLLQQEHAQLLAQLDSCRLAENKAATDLARYATLAAKGITTQQELDHVRYESQRLQAESRLLLAQHRARWQARLLEAQTVLTTLHSESQRLRAEQASYTVCAPTEGTLLDFHGWTAGGFVTAGQFLGSISPDGTLHAEVHVSPRDIGHLHLGQIARLQIDAFPYTQWGTLDGTVTSISADLVGNAASVTAAPWFRVLIRPAANHLMLPNGVRGELKKGLTLTARFLVARRSLWQLLYDDLSTWLDPAAGT